MKSSDGIVIDRHHMLHASRPTLAARPVRTFFVIAAAGCFCAGKVINPAEALK
jgi:hypothetical protein